MGHLILYNYTVALSPSVLCLLSPRHIQQTMAVTAFASPAGDQLQLSLLNVSRLFTRLEHNLLSPATDLRTLRRSEYQRMRVSKVRAKNNEPITSRTSLTDTT
jgi:hypothetical protein